MDSPQQNNKENKPLTEMTKKELLEILWQALNKANSKGVFTINEAFSIKLIYDKLCKDIGE